MFQISDDEDDTHPNIDTPSLFRWRHQARVERMEEQKKKKESFVNEKQRWKPVGMIKLWQRFFLKFIIQNVSFFLTIILLCFIPISCLFAQVGRRTVQTRQCISLLSVRSWGRQKLLQNYKYLPSTDTIDGAKGDKLQTILQKNINLTKIH